MDNTKDEVILAEETIALDKPKSVYGLSKSLKKVIVENKLFTNIKGKNYVNVEGWQLAGELTGIFPKVKSVEQVMTGTSEIKYRAEVSLFTMKDGKTVGYGVAICSNKEYSKRNFDEYAVASMAQTRAVSKAYRMTLGWLMKLAGYEATPADEMPADVAEAETIVIKTAPQKATPPSSKQLDCLKVLLLQAGKTPVEIASTIAKARQATSAQVSVWIEEARKLKPQTPEEKMDAISHTGFKEAVTKSVVSPDNIDDQVDARRDQEDAEREEALNKAAEIHQERMAGY